MSNEHNTKCLCGKGTVHFHFDNYGRSHSQLNCPECSRRYHVNPFGLLPRHIPLKFPKDEMSRRIHNLQWHVSHKEPMYHPRDTLDLMTDEEKIIMYGPDWSTRDYWWYNRNDATGRISLMQSLMCKLAYQYTLRELLILHDCMDDSVYNPTIDSISKCYSKLSEDDIQQCFRRTIIDYKRHEELQVKWKAEQERSEEQLDECLQKQRAQHEELKRQWKECVITWEQLEEV